MCSLCDPLFQAKIHTCRGDVQGDADGAARGGGAPYLLQEWNLDCAAGAVTATTSHACFDRVKLCCNICLVASQIQHHFANSRTNRIFQIRV